MKTLHLFFSAIVILIVVSCNTQDPEPEPQPLDLTKIAEATHTGIKVTLYADKERLAVGFNALYLILEDAHGKISGYQNPVTLSTTMDMPGMEHGSPVVQPVYDEISGLYIGGAVFTRPSGDLGNWKLHVKIEDTVIDLDLTVQDVALNNKPVGSYTGTDGKIYLVTLVEPHTPQAGINNVLILVNEEADPYSFPAVTDLFIEMEAEMITMGHGSPNNDHPIDSGEGFYQGKVNLTMPGNWRLHFKLSRDETVLVEDAFLDLTF